jgi:uncharacterized protein YjgD (DUF1641 family)
MLKDDEIAAVLTYIIEILSETRQIRFFLNKVRKIRAAKKDFLRSVLPRKTPF